MRQSWRQAVVALVVSLSVYSSFGQVTQGKLRSPFKLGDEIMACHTSKVEDLCFGKLNDVLREIF